MEVALPHRSFCYTRPVRLTLALCLSLLGSAGALTVSGTAPPWIGGASFRQLPPPAALSELTGGRSDVVLSSLPLSPPPAGLGRLISVPVGVYAVAAAYNLPGVDLRLDLNALCALLGGEIRMWDDPRLAALNPGAKLPALPVLPSSLTVPNAASLTLARACVGAGRWPPARLKPSWQAGAVYLRPDLAAVQRDLARPGALAVLVPRSLPRGAQVARLRAVGGDFVAPAPQLGLGSSVGPPGSGLIVPPARLLPQSPGQGLPPANLPGSYPLRGLIWATFFQDQGYGGRSPQDARALLAWLEGLRAGGDPHTSPLPPEFRSAVRLYHGGQTLTPVSP